MTTTSGLSRRHLLRAGLTAGVVSAFGLTSCSNEGRGGGDSPAENDAVSLPDHIPYDGVQPDLVGEDQMSNGMLAYPKDPVVATEGAPGDGSPVSALAMSNSPAPPTLSNNTYWKELNNRLGFDLSMTLVPTGDWDERFQTTVAGDKLPDLFSFFPESTPSLPGMLAEKAVDLTSLLSGSAVEKYPFLANIPTDSWQHTVAGGKIYGIPIARGAALSSMIYGRQDLLGDRGVTAGPDSWEAFYDICADATAGRANAWAVGAVPMDTIRQMFEIPNQWGDEGGRLVNAREADRQKEALEAGRRLVADQLIHPDAFSVDQTQRKNWLSNGTVVFLEDTFSAWLGFHQLAEPKKIGVAVYPPPKADGGGTASIWLGSPTHNVTAISKGAEERTEALLDVLNYLAAPFGTEEHLFKTFGLEGVHHTLDGSDPVLTEKGRSETALSLTYLSEGPYIVYQAGAPDVTQAQFDAMSATVPTGTANAALGLFSQTQSRKGGQINGALDDLQADILQGRQPVSAWDDGVASWKSGGGDKIRDELQKALDDRQGA